MRSEVLNLTSLSKVVYFNLFSIYFYFDLKSSSESKSLTKCRLEVTKSSLWSLLKWHSARQCHSSRIYRRLSDTDFHCVTLEGVTGWVWVTLSDTWWLSVTRSSPESPSVTQSRPSPRCGACLKSQVSLSVFKVTTSHFKSTLRWLWRHWVTLKVTLSF